MKGTLEQVVGGPLTFSDPQGRGPDFGGGGCTLTLLDTFDELGKRPGSLGDRRAGRVPAHRALTTPGRV